MVNIALLGYGTVGSCTHALIDKHKERLEQQHGIQVEVKSVMVRRPERYMDSPAAGMMTTRFENLMASEPEIVVEALGGVHPAFNYVKQCLMNGIHVITANKDLIAEKGDELRAAARENGVGLFYEASVAGGIPVIKPIRECLCGNRLTKVQGILNGTTNYILTQMHRLDQSYDEALKDAQTLGYAESDPTSDVDGLDASRKLAILAREALGYSIDWRRIPVQGIRGVNQDDIQYAKDKRYRIRLMAYAVTTPTHFHCHVRPAFVGEDALMSQVELATNGVVVEGDAVGALSFIGQGAGGMPTASAILSDLNHILMKWKSGKDPIITPDNTHLAYTAYNPVSCPWVMAIRHDAAFQGLASVVAHQSVEVVHPQDGKVLYLQTQAIDEVSCMALIQQLTDAGFKVERHYPVYLA